MATVLELTRSLQNANNFNYNPSNGTFLGGRIAPSPQAPAAGPAPAATPAPTYSAPVDPYAQWGGKAAYDAKVNSIMGQKDSWYDSFGSNLANKGISYNSGILDFLDSLGQGQKTIETKAAKNELAKMTGQSGVLGMVGRGIKSSGVMLGNKNAGDSSAAGAIANAYGEIGTREMANVGNQYEMGNKDIALMQGQQDLQEKQGARKIDESKQMYINEMLSSANQAFSSLNAQLEGASLPQRIAIEQEKQRVKDQILNSLKGYDATLATGRANINPGSGEARRTAAIGMRDAGVGLGADAFNFTSEAPMQMQGQQAPAGSGLPLYMIPRGRKAA